MVPSRGHSQSAAQRGARRACFADLVHQFVPQLPEAFAERSLNIAHHGLRRPGEHFRFVLRHDLPPVRFVVRRGNVQSRCRRREGLYASSSRITWPVGTMDTGRPVRSVIVVSRS